jgi:hypothetical protein
MPLTSARGELAAQDELHFLPEIVRAILPSVIRRLR